MICQYKDIELLGIGTLWVSLGLGPQTCLPQSSPSPVCK